MSSTPFPGSTLIPSLRYRDANAAIEFLERAFGFVRHAFYPGENPTVGHAELRHGSGMIMVGSATNRARMRVGTQRRMTLTDA